MCDSISLVSIRKPYILFSVLTLIPWIQGGPVLTLWLCLPKTLQPILLILLQVVANCLTYLQEIWSLEASTSKEAAREREALLRKPVVYYFLNRIKEFNEWAQCIVLELVSKYVPLDSEEIFNALSWNWSLNMFLQTVKRSSTS